MLQILKLLPNCMQRLLVVSRVRIFALDFIDEFRCGILNLVLQLYNLVHGLVVVAGLQLVY